MSANLSRPISLSELAGVCGLSSTHFSRAFREATGKPPHAYLIDLRLKRAVDLLEHTRLSITEIALSCGFDQPQYFATVFRSKFGFTPSLWRIERGL
jgi:AraC family transcriptional regulator